MLTLILNSFSCEPNVPIIPKFGPLPNYKKLFLWLSEWNDALLSTPKLITFLAKSLWKHNELTLSNVISYPLSKYFSLSIFFTILVTPNKKFVNLKLLAGFLGQAHKLQKM